MIDVLKRFDGVYYFLGRVLLGAYFLLPGIMKVVQYTQTQELMLLKGVPFTAMLLPLTILLQVGLGLLVITGKHLRMSALLLFGLTLLINLFIHNFWELQGQPSFEHELQNFIKNLAIAAGLLILATKQAERK